MNDINDQDVSIIDNRHVNLVNFPPEILLHIRTYLSTFGRYTR